MGKDRNFVRMIFPSDQEEEMCDHSAILKINATTLEAAREAVDNAEQLMGRTLAAADEEKARAQRLVASALLLTTELRALQQTQAVLSTRQNRTRSDGVSSTSTVANLTEANLAHWTEAHEAHGSYVDDPSESPRTQRSLSLSLVPHLGDAI